MIDATAVEARSLQVISDACPARLGNEDQLLEVVYGVIILRGTIWTRGYKAYFNLHR